MPLYEYRCEKCGEQFEVIEKFSDQPLTTHDKCGGMVHRLISAPALQFKGSGWYVTDYAKDKGGDNGAPKPEKPAPTSSSGSESASGTTAPSAPSSETKSDTKSNSSDTK